MSISVCMVVKNEQQLLEGCLKSIINIADEIIIVDTGSTDKTIEIAKRFTDKIYNYKCKEDSAGAGCEARNVSISYATKEWILVIDGDEIFEQISVDELKKIVNESKAVAYTVIQRNYTKNIRTAGFTISNKFSFPGYYDNRIVRLFKNNLRVQFESYVHETVDNSIIRMNKNILDSNIMLHHLRELKSIERKKQLNYLRLYEKKIKENPNDIDTHFGMAIIYQNQLNDYDKAVYHFKKTLELAPKKIEAFINLSYVLIMNLNSLEESKKILDDALDYYPNNSDLLNNYAVYCIKSNNLAKADEITNRVIKSEPNNISALMNKGFLCVMAQNFDLALKIFDKIIGLTPNFIEARFNKALVFLKKNETEKAKMEFQKILKINPNFKMAKDLLQKLK